MRRGLYVRFAREMDPGANARVHALAERLLNDSIPGVIGIIPGIVTLYIEYESARLSSRELRSRLECTAGTLTARDRKDYEVKELPVNYGGEDLDEVARRVGLTAGEVIRRHRAPLYTVYLVGFSPGQPYLGEVDPSLRIPRRPNPRPRVPPSSLVIANSLTTIGPFAQPTGWTILGQALEWLYDPNRAQPALFGPGDRVRFVPSPGEMPPEPEPLALLPAEPHHPLLRVEEPGLLDIVVDDVDVPFSENLGVARSGPLDRHSARLANALVGNPATSPLLEMSHVGPGLAAVADGVVAFAGSGLVPLLDGNEVETFRSFALRRGDRLSFRPSSQGVRGYLAIAGGIESGTFQGSASVRSRARVGRPLGRGDILGRAHPTHARPGFTFKPHRLFPSADSAAPMLRIVPGPQATVESLAELTTDIFEVASADRVGVRLAGPTVSGGEVVSEAVPIGSIQVPPAGTPIVLLNDRGTTGGYHKPAILHPVDLPLAGQLRPGIRVRFELVRPKEPLFEWIDLF
jgi:KipI family sensor histidine kinase inhibitor